MTRRCLGVEGLRSVLVLEGGDSLLSVLQSVTTGWRFVEVDGSAPHASITLREAAGEWRCDGPAYAEPRLFRDPEAAACSVVASLYKTETLLDRSMVCLHAAGIRIGGGVVLLTGAYRTGKSIVSAVAAASGLQVFSDDIVPLMEGGRKALGVGVAIRLRRPLPELLSPATLSYLDRHDAVAGRRYRYVLPPEKGLARRGTRAPVVGIAMLRREEGGEQAGEAVVSGVGRGAALREAIRRNFARETPAGTILEALDMLTGAIPAISLRYARPEDAVACLREVFEAGHLPAAVPDQARAAGSKARRAARQIDGAARVRRAAGARLIERDGVALVVNADETAIFELNPTGAAAWRALEEPHSANELMDLFRAAWPEVESGMLRRDLHALLGELADRRLIAFG